MVVAVCCASNHGKLASGDLGDRHGGRRLAGGSSAGQRAERRLVTDVGAGLLAQQPPDLEQVAIGLRPVARSPDRPVSALGPGREGLVQPEPSRHPFGHIHPPLAPQPVPVGLQVLQQHRRLTLPDVEARQRLQLVGVECAPRYRRRQAHLLARAARRLEPDLLDGEAAIVEPTEPGPDLVTVVKTDDGLLVEERPQLVVPADHALGLGHQLFGDVLLDLEPRRHVEEAAQHVLDHDVEVELSLAVAQPGMQLGRLGIDQPGVDGLTVAHEQGVVE